MSSKYRINGNSALPPQVTVPGVTILNLNQSRSRFPELAQQFPKTVFPQFNVMKEIGDDVQPPFISEPQLSFSIIAFKGAINEHGENAETHIEKDIVFGIVFDQS
jgi:hypothetical protein